MLQLLLYPLACVYAMVTSLRNYLFARGIILRERSFPLPVVCVGNLSVGGTGKTPHTEYLIRLLSARASRRVAVLSRGYGRSSRGYVRADASATAQLIGDEPYQMYTKFPTAAVAVCANRCEGIETLMRTAKPDVILLDDAFQHRYVRAGLNLLLTDYARPYSRDCLLPAGRLRERRVGARRAHVIVVTKCPPGLTRASAAALRAELRLMPHQQLFFSAMRYGARYPLFGSALRPPSHAALVLTGIARPAPLHEHLRREGIDVTPLSFADHHAFTPADLRTITAAFAALPSGAKVITTEKDAARLRAAADALPEGFKQAVEVQPIEIEILFNEAARFNQIITHYADKN